MDNKQITHDSLHIVTEFVCLLEKSKHDENYQLYCYSISLAPKLIYDLTQKLAMLTEEESIQMISNLIDSLSGFHTREALHHLRPTFH
jgi:hypothetical protein